MANENRQILLIDADLDRLRTSQKKMLDAVESWFEEFRRTNRRHPRKKDYPAHVLGPGLGDIQNLRLASHMHFIDSALVLTALSVSFFKQQHTIRPRRDHLLKSVTESNPDLLDIVKTLVFEIGRINSRYAVEKNSLLFKECGSYVRDDMIRRYGGYNLKHYREDEDMARIVTALSHHRKLEGIKIQYYEDGYEWRKLANVFHGRWPYDARSESFQMNAEFLTILQAMAIHNASGRPTIKHLSHESLSPSFFVHLFSHNPIELRDLTLPFQHLETLHLNFKGVFKAPLKSFWKGLATALRNATGLKSLSFGFDPVVTERHQTSDWTKPTLPADKEAWYLPLHLVNFGACASLRTLRLNGLSTCERGLQFLLGNYPALRELQLCQISLREGSFSSLVNFVRSELSLTKFELCGWLSSEQGYWLISPDNITDGMNAADRRFPAGDYTRYTFDGRTAEDMLWETHDTDALLSEWDPSNHKNWRKYDSITEFQREPDFVSKWSPVEIVPYFDKQGRDPNGLHYTDLLSWVTALRERRLPQGQLYGIVLLERASLKTEISQLLTRDSLLAETNQLHIQEDGAEVLYCWDSRSEEPIAGDLHQQIVARGNKCRENWVIFDYLYDVSEEQPVLSQPLVYW
ncbi:uncharacterized protein RCO7_03785 [Rhynchosporium graminicola]|uniref:Uncharacterized protein n=1 Tax=Rhynchosporium graminicola TaxID=2792576 RepID=A0A1E1LM98_9HELO|nr:uncharacterized protein RCO7_03785 [Rhynchosporium commune]